MVRHTLVALFLALFPLAAFAQIIPTIGPALELAATPENPGAGETVTVRALNLGATGSATFVWRVNGRVVDQGIGVSAISVTVGELGEPTVVSVTASNGGTVLGERTLTITPAGVDIVWEGVTYTPPLYPGRALPNPSSAITLHAIPNVVSGGNRVSSGNLVYSWYINSSQAPTASGYGRSTLTIRPPQFTNSFTVRVRAETSDGSVSASGATTIEPVSPEILFYERSPLIGYRFNRAIENSYALGGEEVTVGAFPLYVGDADTPTYRWTLDGRTIEETSQNGREVTFRRSGSGSGAFGVTLTLENAAALFERARSNFLLTF